MSHRLRFDLPRWQPRLAVTSAVVALALAASSPGRLHAQAPTAPYAALVPAASMSFPGDTDSNSPAVWEILGGTWTLTLFSSVAGWTELSRGANLRALENHGDVRFDGAPPPGGLWFESVIRDAEAWYGFYHNEREHVVCEGSGKVWPRIGLARSHDRGLTWQDLGPVIETPASSVTCATNNRYFVGGVGDFSVLLDADRQFAYIYYTQYIEAAGLVGVSVARMAWADRDQPGGRVDIWSDGVWLPPSPALPVEDDPDGAPTVAVSEWDFPLATPFLPAANRWDDARRGVDVYWGPSIHWNTVLETYVMLLNDAVSNTWEQGGIYVSFNDRLDDPAGWSVPALLTSGGRWYPQVIGLEPTSGTDAFAGRAARFFMGGRSDHLIVFGRR